MIGCVAEPDYTGRACGPADPCPDGWWCTPAEVCASGLRPASDAGASDAGQVDAASADAGHPDAAPEDVGPGDAGVALTTLEVTPDAVMLAAGASAALTARARWENGATADVTAQATWRVRDPAVGQVSQDGLLTALAPGATVVEATFEGLTATAALAVSAAEVVEAHTWNKHNLVLLTDGTVWGWGWNAHGQVDASPEAVATTPRALPITDVAAVRAGGAHSVALRRDGTVWAWGNDQAGQLGRGAASTSREPTPQPVLSAAGSGDLRDVADVRCGYDFCLALTRGGSVLAWGADSFGSLGMGGTGPKARPTPVPGLSQVRAVAAGTYHALALRQDGVLLSWGYNEYGQLGRGALGVHQAQVGVVTLVVGGTRYTPAEVDAGWGHTLVRTTTGRVLTFGWAAYQQLGRDTQGSDTLSPGLVDLQDVLRLEAGFAFSLAVGADGVVRAFGSNLAGQLGDGTVGGLRLAPAPVLNAPGGVPFTTPTTWHAGGDHVLAHTRTQVWTFGSNESGELGNGRAGVGEASGVPAPVTW
jgi:alpha-tubulin suppressor-like RCC1 family protein